MSVHFVVCFFFSTFLHYTLYFIPVTWLNFSFCNEFDLAVIKKKVHDLMWILSLVCTVVLPPAWWWIVWKKYPSDSLVILSAIKEAQSFWILFSSNGMRNLFLNCLFWENDQNYCVFSFSFCLKKKNFLTKAKYLLLSTYPSISK